MDDQHRFDYLGCAGADFVRTPNIDSLANEGRDLPIAQAIAPSVHHPAYPMATGLMAHRVAPFDNDSYLSNRVPTYYQQLRDLNELYDLAADPDEISNLIDKEPALAQKLGRTLAQRMQAGKWLR